MSSPLFLSSKMEYFVVGYFPNPAIKGDGIGTLIHK